MNAVERQKALILKSSQALLGCNFNTGSLGRLASTLVFLTSVLRDHGDSLPQEVEYDIAALEELYGVALDQEWSRLPEDMLALVIEAVEHVYECSVHSLGEVSEDD